MHANADETSLTTTESNSTESDRETATESSGNWTILLDEYGFSLTGDVPELVSEAIDAATHELMFGAHPWHTEDDHAECLTPEHVADAVSDALADARIDITNDALQVVHDQAHDTRWPVRLCDDCRPILRDAAGY